LEKTLKMGRASAIGSFQLFIGMAISGIILVVGAIFLARLLSPAEYGLYSVALLPSLMITIFRDWGVNAALTKYIANLRATGKEDEIPSIISGGLIFQIAIGILLALISVILAEFIATSIFRRPEVAPLISIAAITIFSGSLLLASQAIFIGFEKMKYQSLTLIFQSVVQSLVSPLLVIIGYGALGAVIGYTFSFLVACIVGVVIFYFFLFRRLKRPKINQPATFATIKSLLRYGVPLSISTIIVGFLAQFYRFMMAIYSSDVLIGNFQAAVNFTIILTFIANPIQTVLFPAFSKLNPQNEPKILKSVFVSSVKYTAMFLIPATTAVMVLSEPMIGTLFGEQWVYAPLYLTLYVIKNLFSGFGNLSVNNLLTGIGKTKIVMKFSLLRLLLGVVLSFLLIPSLGVIGVILVYLVAGVPSVFLGLRWIWKHYNVTVDWGSSARIYLASAVSAAITFVILNFLNTADWMKLIVGGIIFLIIYIIVAPSIGAVDQDDIQNLKIMLSSMGFISKIVNIPLDIVAKIAQLRSPKEEVPTKKL